MLQRLFIPEDPAKDSHRAYLEDCVVDTMTRCACQKSAKVLLVGKSCFLYKRLATDGASDSARRWTQKQQLFVDGNLLLIPVCKGLHWFLVVVDLAAGKLVVVDSGVATVMQMRSISFGVGYMQSYHSVA